MCTDPKINKITFCFNVSKDEEVDRTESDALNGFPPMKMSLLPGGCGIYEFPVRPGQINCFIQPAKKKGDLYWVSIFNNCHNDNNDFLK